MTKKYAIDQRIFAIDNRDMTYSYLQCVWREYQFVYKTRIYKKQKSRLMQTVGWYFEKRGIMTKKQFLNDFITTIKRKIFMPYVLTTTNFSKHSQLLHCVHEHKHVDDKVGITYLYSPKKLPNTKPELISRKL